MSSILVHRMIKALFATAACALFALPVVAQDARGTFKLTHEVHWGASVFPPGEYAYSLAHHSPEILLVRPMSGGESQLVLAHTVAVTYAAATNQLFLQQHHGEWFVSSMVLDDLGEQLFFKMPGSVAAAEGHAHSRTASISGQQ